MTAGDDRRIRMEWMVEPPLYLESLVGLPVDKRIAIEESSALTEDRPALTAESGAYLWLCSFVYRFVTTSTFEAVIA